MTLINISKQKILTLLLLLCFFTALTSVSVADDSDYYSKIYLLEGDILELSYPSGTTLHSGNPFVIELDGDNAVAKGAGNVLIYYEKNGEYHRLCEIVVLGDKLEVLTVMTGGTLPFSTVPYINVTAIPAVPADAAEFVGTNPFSSYDVVFYPTGSYPIVEPANSALWDGNESGSLMMILSTRVSLTANLISHIESLPDYLDYMYLPEYLGNYGHSNQTFAEQIRDAYMITTTGTISGDQLIEMNEGIAPILAKHALWKMIYTVEESLPSSVFLENAKAVLENPVSQPEDYIRETHKLKKELSENVRISKVVIDQSDIQMKLGTQKELNATVLTNAGIASGIEITWKSDDESVAVVSYDGIVTAVGVGTANITANIDGKLPATCMVTVGKYLEIFLKDNQTVYSDSAILSHSPLRGLFENSVNTRSSTLFDDLSNYDIIFATVTSRYYNDSYNQSRDDGSILIMLNSSRMTQAQLNNGLANRSHVTIGATNATTAMPIGVYSYESNSIPMTGAFAEYLQGFNLDRSGEKIEDFIKNGEIEKEALKTFIDKHSSLDPSDYTAGSWTAFSDQYDEAVLLLNDAQTTKVELAEILYDLKEVYFELEYLNPGTVTSVEVPIDLQLSVNSRIKIGATVTGTDLKVFDVVWSSDNPSVATVDEAGIIKAVSRGEANITATSVLDGSKSDSLKVDVVIPVHSLILNLQNVNLVSGGDTVQLTGYVQPLTASSSAIQWKSLDTSIAAVDSNGLVTPVAPGRTTVEATVTFDQHFFNTSGSENIELIKSTFTVQCDIFVKAAPEDRIRILFVGETPYAGLQSAADSMYYCGYFDYDFISGYNSNTFEISQELVDISEDFDTYHVVYFDMFGDYDSISENLLKAKDSGTKFVSLESNAQPPEYFQSFSAAADRDNSVLYGYFRQVSVNNFVSTASFLWGEKFLVQSAKEYAPESKLPTGLKNEKPLKILYIGKDASNFSNAVSEFGSGVYGDAADWTVLPYNETSKEYEKLFNYTNASTGALETWEADQIDSINNHLKEHVNEKQYDIIIVDGIEGPMGTKPTPTHLTYLPEVGSAVENGSSLIILGKVGVWLPMNLGFHTTGASGTSSRIDSTGQNTVLTFGLTEEEVSAGNRYLFSVVQKYGHERVQSWLYTSNVGSTGSEGYYHPLPGLPHLKFSSLNTYIPWATQNGYFDPSKPTVGLWMFGSDIGPGTDALIYALEKEGVNVIAGYGTFDEIPKYYTWTDSHGQKQQIDAAISIKNFGLNYWDYNEGVRQLEEMDISVLKGFFATGSKDIMTNVSDINNMVDAVNGARMTLSPNRDGIFEFIYLGHMNATGDGKSLGVQAQIDWMAERAAAWAYLKQKENSQKDIAILYYNYPPGKADIGANYLNVMRSLAGNSSLGQDGILRTMNQTGVYTDVHGKDLGGYDVDFTRLPKAIRNAGSGTYSYEYYSGSGKSDAEWRDYVMDEDNLMNLMLAQGINVGSHAPGVLDGVVQDYISYLKAGGDPEMWWGSQLLPMSTYQKWYEETNISDDLRNEITSVWGKPWEDAPPKDQSGMIWQDKEGYFGTVGELYFVFPAVRMGNVWVLPQPDRALASDIALAGDLTGLSSTDYHGDIPPTHQYVAFYFWLNHGMTNGNIQNDNSDNSALYENVWTYEWKPDAIIHFGTHGTQEWLPGTAIGMQQGIDWGPILIGHLPNIYPYIVANVGEGLTAEYRGDALIIDHLTQIGRASCRERV